MGLLDYYRQFEAMSEQEVSAGLRERAAAERAKALARVEVLDLSVTTTPHLPHSEIVNAITYAARGWGLNRYPDRHATALRQALANHHGVDPRQVVVGDGASQLLATAAGAFLGPDHELITPWPSYPLYPLMARWAGGRAVPVPGFDPEALLEAVTEDTRMVAICNPNDPTGERLDVDTLAGLLGRLRDDITVLLDEALVDYVTAEATDASLPLLQAFPRLVIFRTFSKAWGLGGMRCGYAIGAPGSDPILERLAPPLGVSALTQAGALEALRREHVRVERRRDIVRVERERLERELAGTLVHATPSQANFLWLSVPGIDGDELARRLERQALLVQRGAPLGADDHVRAAVQSPEASDRLLRALEVATR